MMGCAACGCDDGVLGAMRAGRDARGVLVL